MESNWYDSFFHGVALEFWSKLNPPEVTIEEADFLESELDCRPGAHLLDIPCGNGRHALELAPRGYRVTGVDNSEEFLQEAQNRTQSLGRDIEFQQRDMRHLPWEAEFDGAYCLGNSFGYMAYDGMMDFVSAVSQALKPGARFVLETGMAAECILLNLEENEWYHVDDIFMLLEHHYNCAEGRLDTKYTFIRNGETDTRFSCHWVYTVAEIQRMLGLAGLSTLSLYGSLDRQPFELGAPHLILTAQKQ